MTDKDKKIFVKFGLWFGFLLLIIVFGISNVFADTTIDTSQFFTITGRKWSDNTLEYSSNPQYNNDWLLNNYNITGGIYTPPNQFDYIEFLYFEHNTSIFNPCNSTGKFTASFNLLFTTPSFVDYISSIKWGNDNCSISEKNNTTGLVRVSCIASPSSNNYTDLYVNFNTISGTNQSYLYVSRNIDIACGLNTDAIINNDNANTQNIINNNNSNTQNIIDNQNQNTQDMIDSQQVCTNKIIDKEDIVLDNKYLSSSGLLNNNNSYGVTDYIPVDKIVRVISQGHSTINTCFYDEDKTLISCVNGRDLSTSIPSNTKYLRMTIYKVDSTPKIEVEFCQNGNQALAEQNEEAESTRKGIFKRLGELISTLFSNDDADISGLDNMVGWLPAGPLDSIINLPLNLFNSLTNVLSGTCTSVTLTLPFVNQQLVLPCFDTFMSQYLTSFSTIWTFIGVTVSVFILYNYLLTLYKWVDDTLTMRENNLPGYYDDNWGGGA